LGKKRKRKGPERTRRASGGPVGGQKKNATAVDAAMEDQRVREGSIKKKMRRENGGHEKRGLDSAAATRWGTKKFKIRKKLQLRTSGR